MVINTVFIYIYILKKILNFGVNWVLNGNKYRLKGLNHNKWVLNDALNK